MARLSFRCKDELVVAVDEVRGEMPRETWLRDVIQSRVDMDDRVKAQLRHEQEIRDHAAVVPRSLADLSERA